jgi:hypothetical protein
MLIYYYCYCFIVFISYALYGGKCRFNICAMSLFKVLLPTILSDENKEFFYYFF